MPRPPSSPTPYPRHIYLLVVLVLATLWFAWLGQRDLFEPDEGRYAQIPLEMLASGDWITPRLHGIKYFEKPPLQYWATAATFALLGPSPTTARLWTAVCGLLGALWAGWMAVRLYGLQAGFFAFVVTLSGMLYTGAGHIVTLDMALALFMVLGVGNLVLAQDRRDRPARLRNRMLAGWVALGLAVLVKGPVALVLPGMAVVLYSLWQRDWALWRHLHLGKGLLVCLAVAAPWFVAVSRANPEFAHFFFIHEHLERYTSTVHHRTAPPLYFVFILLLGSLPWTAVVTVSLVRPAFRWLPAAGAGFDPERFLWTFALVVLLFFSLSQSKLPAYILPMMPVLGVLAGRRLAERGFLRADAWLTLGAGIALLLLAWQAARLGDHKTPAELYVHGRPWLAAAGAVLVLAGLGLLRPWRRTLTRVALAGILGLLAFRLLLTAYGSLAPVLSSRDLARAIRAETDARVPVFVVRDHDPNTLPFYLGRPFTLVAHRSELSMGIDAEPQRWIPTLDAFLARWQTLEQAVAVLSPRQYEAFRGRGIPMRVIHRAPRQITVVKQ